MLPFVKRAKPVTVIYQLKKKDNTMTISLSKITDCLFQELFAPAPSTGSLNIFTNPKKDARWPKQKSCEIKKKVLYQQAPYKTPVPDDVKTIVLNKAWKDRYLCRAIIRIFRECVRIGCHHKIFREGQTVILRKSDESETLARFYRPINLLNYFSKLLEKMILQRLAALTIDTIPKYQFGSCNGFSTVDVLAKLASNFERNLK